MKRTLALLLALLMVLSTVSFAAPSMASTATTAQETQTQTQAVPQETAALEAETIDWVDEKYGNLVFKLDFETETKFEKRDSNGPKIASHGIVNSKYSSSANWWISVNGFGEMKKVTENGNTFLRAGNGTGSTNQLMFESGLKDISGDLTTFTGENGYYTYFIDVRANLSEDSKINRVENQNMYRYWDGSTYQNYTKTGSLITAAQLKAGGWITKEETQSATVSGTYTLDSLHRYRPIFFYNAAPAIADVDIFDIDNVMLYFKPFSVDFTVAGNENINDVELKIDIPADTLKSVYTKSELLDLVNAKSGVKCLDLTLADGSAFESIDVVEVSSVKGVFKTYQINHPDYGTLLYDIDFENENDLTNDQNMALQGFVNTNFKGSENWKVGFAQVASAVKVTENGNTFVRMKNNKNQHPQFQTMAVSRFEGLFTEENGYFTVTADIRANISGNSGGTLLQFFSQTGFQKTDGSAYNHNDLNKIMAKDIPSDNFFSTTQTMLYKDADSLRRINYAYKYEDGKLPTDDNADTFDVDNLKLYFKPNKVEIKILGDESLSIADKTVEVATTDVSYVMNKEDLIEAIEVDEYIVIDDLVLADGSSFETIDLDDVTTFKAVYRKYETYDETYGHVVFNLDFEISETFKEKDKIALHGMVNSNYSSSADWWINNSNCGTITLASDENGNSFLRVGNATAGNSQVMFESGTAQLTGDLSTFNGENGYYTYSYDIRPNADVVDRVSSQSFYRYKDGNSWNQTNKSIDTRAFSVNNWANINVKLDNATSGNVTLDSLYRFRPVIYYKQTPTVANAFTFDIDNVILYFKPFSVDVTVLGGDNADFEAQKVTVAIEKETLDSTITKSELMALVENDTGMILSDLVLSDGSSFESIDVMKVTEVKAIWETLNPESYSDSSIRTTDPTGIRFRSAVTTAQKENATEYGFIVTLEKHLGENDATALTIDSDITKVTGVSYGYDTNVGKDVDRIYEIDGDKIFFTAVVYGMPNTAQAYSQKIVVRPYLKDTKGVYYYGTPITRSVKEVAVSIRDGGYQKVDASGREYVENILTICGENI